jgi:ATP-dependent helicase HepA
LLSATPILHHERQLFELLNLLDPYAYPSGSFDQFQLRITKRRELGRAVLALTRSTKPAFIAKHAQRCAELLPQDTYVRQTASACVEAASSDLSQDALMRNVSSLRIHLTETYRIHRRLLRTRRASLVSTGDLLQLRHEELPIYYGQDELFTELWQAVEEWRTKAASHAASQGEGDYDLWVQLYLQILQAALRNPTSLNEILCSQQHALSFSGETSLSEQIREVGSRIGDLGLRQAVSKFVEEYAASGRGVVFSGDALRSSQVARIFREEWDGDVLVATHDMETEVVAQQLQAFRTSDRTVLIGDEVLEEGLNLQCAKGAFIIDLPFDPMRLEQRLGRLDRLDRRGLVRCVSALSLADPTIAFDSAWYEVLTKGFGLLKGSLADQQYLIEHQLLELARAAFEGGPIALVEMTGSVTKAVESERETSAEQDILDGIDVGDLRESSIWKSLDVADEEESAFGEALAYYLHDNLGLNVQKGSAGGGRAGTVLQFGLNRHRDPLLPSTMLARVGSLAGRACTATRTLSSAEPGLDLLRPGHPLVEELRRLADWDERGQAFALWRKAPGVINPILVFRLGIQSSAQLGPVHDELRSLNWDAVSAASLLRLLAGWFPPHYYRLFVDAEGMQADTRLSQLCHRPYDRKFDINLGGERAHILAELTGEAAWPQVCRSVADEALRRVQASTDFSSRRKSAQDAAYEHLQMVLTRLRLRSQAEAESSESIKRLSTEQLELSQLVEHALAQSVLRIDWFGVYVLSEEPVCPR